jgi:hypothetical protein
MGRIFWAVVVGRDRMVVGLTITNAISAYHHKSCEFESSSWRGVLDTTSLFADDTIAYMAITSTIDGKELQQHLDKLV